MKESSRFLQRKLVPFFKSAWAPLDSLSDTQKPNCFIVVLLPYLSLSRNVKSTLSSIRSAQTCRSRNRMLREVHLSNFCFELASLQYYQTMFALHFCSLVSPFPAPLPLHIRSKNTYSHFWSNSRVQDQPNYGSIFNGALRAYNEGRNFGICVQSWPKLLLRPL